MSTSTIINSFVAGELSPRLYGRTELLQYYQSAQELRNVVVEVYGGAKKAPGTYFVNEVKDSDAVTVIEDFVFSDTQAYEIELGDLYMRFYKDNGAILEGLKTITNITTVSSKALVTCNSHGYSNLNTVVIQSVSGMVEVNNKRFLVADQVTDSFYLKDIDGEYIDPTDYTAYASGGTAGKVYEIATSYPTSSLRELQFSQKNDILYITHDTIPQSQLKRLGNATWALSQINYAIDENRPALMKSNVEEISITPSALTGSIVLTSSGASLFDQSHAGSIWLLGPLTGSHAYAQIVSVSASGLKATANATVLYSGTLPNSAAYSDWSEPSWSGYRGYPKAVTISENRLMYGYTKSEPQTSWPSVTGAYETFEVGVEDIDAMTVKADTNKNEDVEWLYPAQEILIGTAGGVTTFGTGSENIALTPTTGRVKKKASYGVKPNILPQMIGTSVFYWQKYGKIMREYVYTLDKDNYETPMAMKISDHITGNGIIDMAYQQSPNNILWCIRDDGKLAVFTVDPNENVQAWTLHDTDGEYESVSVIPKTSYDEVWFVVKRTIDGTTRRYIEYMVAPDFDDQEDQFFVHSGLDIDLPKTITSIVTTTSPNAVQVVSASHGFANLDEVKIRGVVGMTEVNHIKYVVSSAASGSFKLVSLEGATIDGSDYADYESGGEVRKCFSTVSGLDHLENEYVQICADGGAHPIKSVASGSITLNDSYSQVAIGLGYTARIKSNDLEGAPGRLNSQGKTKRVSEVSVSLLRSLGCKVGTDAQMDSVKFRTSAQNTDEAPPLFSGIKRITFPSGWDREKSVIVEQEQPLAMHVRSIISELEVN